MDGRRTNPGIIYRVLDWGIGAENFHRFREDFKKIAIKKVDGFDRWHQDKKTLQKEGLDAAQRAIDSRWDQITFVLTLIGAFTFFLPVIPTLASISSGFLALLTGLRRATVEILVYRNPYDYRHPNNLKFVCAWNRAMEGWTSLSVLPMAIVVTGVPQGYRIGLWYLSSHIEKKY